MWTDGQTKLLHYMFIICTSAENIQENDIMLKGFTYHCMGTTSTDDKKKHGDKQHSKASKSNTQSIYLLAEYFRFIMSHNVRAFLLGT
jgi:hypothetical protein